MLLLPGQESYAALGRAYGELQYHVYTATLYRQYIDTPYVNPQDNRMTPNTFEAYRMTAKYDRVQFTAGYIDAIKPRNDNSFISMSEQAGAPPGRERGMIIAASVSRRAKLFLSKRSIIMSLDVNILYTDVDYTWPLTAKLGLKLQGQFTEQGSVGGYSLRKLPYPSRGRSGVAQLRQRRAQGGVFHHCKRAEHHYPVRQLSRLSESA